MTWNPMASVTPHFLWQEFAVSDSHPELVEPVPDDDRGRVERLAAMLETIRAWGGEPIKTWSGYRSDALNRAIKGDATSQHRNAGAVDWSFLARTGIDGRLTEGAWLALVRADLSLPCGQCIYYPEGREGTPFVHLAVPSERYPEPAWFIHDPARGYTYRRIRSAGAAETALGLIMARRIQSRTRGDTAA